jgi:hypothetical protein
MKFINFERRKEASKDLRRRICQTGPAYMIIVHQFREQKIKKPREACEGGCIKTIILMPLAGLYEITINLEGGGGGEKPRKVCDGGYIGLGCL